MKIGKTSRGGGLSVVETAQGVEDGLIAYGAAKQAGRSKVGLLFNDYSVNSVLTSGYRELISSTAAQVNRVEIFDSSGECLLLAVGGNGSEVDQIHVLPGGNGAVDLLIPAGSRISIKAKTGNAAVGYIAVNLLS